MLKGIDKGSRIGLILVDLQKSLDHMLDHTVLLQKKKECICFRESIIKRFQSYFTKKHFFVGLEDVFWCSMDIYHRSIPLPNIYDLMQALNKTRSYQYLDDTYIFYQD